MKRDQLRAERQAPESFLVRIPRPLTPIQHGTEAGYAAHMRRDIEPCRACREAHAAAQRERSARQPVERAPIQHGTYAGYVAHHKRGELPACDACKEARAEYRRQFKEREAS